MLPASGALCLAHRTPLSSARRDARQAQGAGSLRNRRAVRWAYRPRTRQPERGRFPCGQPPRSSAPAKRLRNGVAATVATPTRPGIGESSSAVPTPRLRGLLAPLVPAHAWDAPPLRLFPQLRGTREPPHPGNAVQEYGFLPGLRDTMNCRSLKPRRMVSWRRVRVRPPRRRSASGS